jgi:uracil phosphoribosyltransferase
MTKKEEMELFELIDRKSKNIYARFSRYYKNDSKPFINKISRDYKKKNKSIAPILKQINKIPKNKYDSAVCILRGGIPYSVLFEAAGWKVHYVLCGRKNEKFGDLRFNKSIDRGIERIKNKKVLLIENNSFTGNTPIMALEGIKKSLHIKKSDLFLDYFVPVLPWAKEVLRFEDNPKRRSMFGKIYVAQNNKVSKNEKEILINKFLKLLK